MADNQFKFDQSRAEDFELILSVGDPLAPDGLTRAELSGNGSLVIEQQHEKEISETYRVEIDRESAERLLRQAAGFEWERGFPSRQGLPDEAVVHWTLKDRAGAAINVRIWLRDTEKNPIMAPVLEELRKIVDRVTNGKLYL